MMLGYMLARAGVETIVLEKHADFLRDFRGDTVHPSTLEVIGELGLLPEFLKQPHQELVVIAGRIGDQEIPIADFSHLQTRCKFVAFMPQWDLLNFLSEHASRFSNFRLRMQAQVYELIEESGRIAGVRAKTPEGSIEVRAALVVGTDGRHSTVRELAGLAVQDFGAPMDVLWMRIPRRPDETFQPLGRIATGKIFVMLNRGDYWQCAIVILKGTFGEIKRRGLAALRADIVALAPFVAGSVAALSDWDDVKLLTVKVDRLNRWWRPGLLCIGDAAHAMSPVGGIGINLAIQDAVAAANILWAPLRAGRVDDDALARVQQRRAWPTKATQAMQVFLQNRIIGRVLQATRPLAPPWPMLLLRRFPYLRRLPARLIGIGLRPEHVRTPSAQP